MVRIFLKAIDQAKNVTFMGTLFCQIFFQGKRVLSWGTRTLLKDLTLNNHLLEGTQHSLSSFSCLNLKEYKSTSQTLVMSCFDKVNIPLWRVFRKIQVIMDNTEQDRKSYLEGLILTHVMSKSNFGATTYLESRMARKLPLASDIFHNPTP